MAGRGDEMTDNDEYTTRTRSEKPFGHVAQMFGRKAPPPLITALSLLMLSENPCHGYMLFKQMCEVGLFEDDAEASLVYPTLRILQTEGLIAPELVDEGSGPARKVFHITADGRTALSGWVEHIREVRASMDYFIDRYEATETDKQAKARPRRSLARDREDKKGGKR
jgi:DNA-binding PadR family transcriptional regulator